MGTINEKDLDDVLAKARALAVGDHPLDSMTIKDLKLAQSNASNTVMTNDQQASIISVFIIAT
jgi:hypothetical protein